jgi:RNA polymerase sigma factor (sigma-70 family)
MGPADDLTERARTGDKDAFGALIRPALEKGFRLALGVLGDRHDAEDATQDAVLTAWRKIGNVRPGSPIEPWFLAIVANRCRKLWRRRARSVVPVVAESSQEFVDGASVRLDVRDALGRLSVEQRLLVVLRYYFDLSLEESARIAGIPVGTAKSRMHRALASLRVDLRGIESSHG